MLNNSMENLDTKEAFITLTTLLNNVVELGPNINFLNVECFQTFNIFRFIQIATCSLNQKHIINLTSCREVNWILLWLLDYSN